MRNHIGYLIRLHNDGTGADPTEVKQRVYCEPYDATRKEFYSAYTIGLAPSMIVDIEKDAWKAASLYDTDKASETYGKLIEVPVSFSMEGNTYDIIRSYWIPGTHKRQLTLSLKQG